MALAEKFDCQTPGARKKRPFKEAKPFAGDHLALIRAASEKSHEQYSEAYRELAKR